MQMIMMKLLEWKMQEINMVSKMVQMESHKKKMQNLKDNTDNKKMSNLKYNKDNMKRME